MSVSFQGVQDLVLTFRADGSAAAGCFAAISANDTVRSAGDGESPVGFILNIRNGYAAVLVQGYVETAYAGSSAPGLGWAELTAQGDGLRAGTGNEKTRRCLVVHTDAESKTMGLFLA